MLTLEISALTFGWKSNITPDCIIEGINENTFKYNVTLETFCVDVIVTRRVSEKLKQSFHITIISKTNR